MKFCPIVPEICRGQVHVAKKERRIIIIIIIRRNGAKTISLQTTFGRLNKVVITKYLAKVKSPRCVNQPKIIQLEQNSILIGNSSLYTNIPKIKLISQIIVKKKW
jgi:hypothetical protein